MPPEVTPHARIPNWRGPSTLKPSKVDVVGWLRYAVPVPLPPPGPNRELVLLYWDSGERLGFQRRSNRLFHRRIGRVPSCIYLGGNAASGKWVMNRKATPTNTQDILGLRRFHRRTMLREGRLDVEEQTSANHWESRGTDIHISNITDNITSHDFTLSSKITGSDSPPWSSARNCPFHARSFA